MGERRKGGEGRERKRNGGGRGEMAHLFKFLNTPLLIYLLTY